MSGNLTGWDTFSGRLKWLVGRDPRSKGEIAAAAEKRQSRLSEWLSSTSPTLESLQGIAKAFPTLDFRWLVTGEGEPFGDENSARRTLAAIRGLLDAGTISGDEGVPFGVPVDPLEGGEDTRGLGTK